MKKIPTLFIRHFENHEVKEIINEVAPGLEWVLEDEGIATVKKDGSCCAVIGGVFYKRYDAKRGKTPPGNAIPCCEPDSVTGHWPHWVPISPGNPADKWFLEAKRHTRWPIWDWTFEAIGPHFQGNPYHLRHDTLVPHGVDIIENAPRDFDGIRDFLEHHAMEGIVFWKDNEPRCKIKRSDFGFLWPVDNT